MRNVFKIALEGREETGKSVCRKLRGEGFIPVVFYGPGVEGALSAKADLKEIQPVFKAGNWETTLIDLVLPDGTEESAIMRDVARHPISDELLHVDFYKLVKGQKISVRVPVELVGREACIGAKEGGIIELHLHEIEMEVLPAEIPQSILVDVSALDLDDMVLVSELTFPESAHLLVDESELVAAISRPRAVDEEEVEEAEASEEAEVEVVGKGKKDEEA